MKKSLTILSLIGFGIAASQAIASDYAPIISPTHETQGGFKAKNHPSTLNSVSSDTTLKALSYQYPGGDRAQLRFFLPPGTVAVDANFSYYLTTEPGMGALSFKKTTEHSSRKYFSELINVEYTSKQACIGPRSFNSQSWGSRKL